MQSGFSKFELKVGNRRIREILFVTPRRSAFVRVALTLPADIRVFLSSLGVSYLYRVLNSMEGVSAERVFLETIPYSAETKTHVAEFDIWMFSIPFEINYFQAVWAIRRAGIEVLSSQRGPYDPILIAGGVAPSLNPVPILGIFDLVFVGEGDTAVYEIVHTYTRCKLRGLGREETIGELEKIDGMLGKNKKTTRYRRAEVEKLRVPSSGYVSAESDFPYTFLVEVGRGCLWGCKFCAIRWLAGKARFFSKESISSALREAGGLDWGLIAPCASDHPDLLEIIRTAPATVHLSSIRVDTLSEDLAKALAKKGMRTFTIAPETGSDSLRFSIGKRFTNEKLLEKVRMLRACGVPNLKLYFMVGLPGETEGDLEAIISLCKEVVSVGFQGIRITLAPFVPKPFTPFERKQFAGIQYVKNALHAIAGELASMGISVSSTSARQAYLETVLSRGNGKIQELLAASNFRHEPPLSWVKGKLREMGIKESLYVGVPARMPWRDVVKLEV